MPRWTLWGGLALALVLTVWSARAINLDITELFREQSAGTKRLFARVLNPNWSYIWRVWQAWLETLYIAVIAAVVGNGIGLAVAMLASKVTANRFVFRFTKTVLNVVRSLPDVAWGMLFSAIVGTGALAGILALTVFNIGISAKLTSETIDAVDLGPIEAADAAGANRVQRARAAVLPQIAPNFASYALYIFELNIRASTVIGLVGGGGIGYAMNVALSRPNSYENVVALVVALFVVVFLIDRLSIFLRRRLT